MIIRLQELNIFRIVLSLAKRNQIFPTVALELLQYQKQGFGKNPAKLIQEGSSVLHKLSYCMCTQMRHSHSFARLESYIYTNFHLSQYKFYH